MDFLPQDYEAPKSSSFYMKLNEGENRFRIMSRPILGWEDWQDKKPVRYRMDDKPAKSFDPKKPVKHFWTFIVFNYREEQIQILQITQATIRKSLEALCKDRDWGSPFAYDIKIMKTGEGVDTEYSVNPVPHKPVDEYLVQCFKDRPINLEALFIGADPFDGKWEKYTPLAVGTPVATASEPRIAKEQADELKIMFNECDPAYKTQLMETLTKLPKPVKALEEVPPSIYEKIKLAVKSKRDEYQSFLHGSEDLFAKA